jgi:hypothetical protein
MLQLRITFESDIGFLNLCNTLDRISVHRKASTHTGRPNTENADILR